MIMVVVVVMMMMVVATDGVDGDDNEYDAAA